MAYGLQRRNRRSLGQTEGKETVPISTVQDGIELAKKQFQEHLAVQGAVWTSLTVTGPGSTKITHRETNPDAEKEWAKA